MEIIRGLPERKKKYKNPVIALGNFDGVHLGHQEILKRVVQRAKKIEGTSIVITFDPHPLKILAPEKCPPLINSFKEKAEILESLHIDVLIGIRFDRKFSSLNSLAFVKKIIIDNIGAREVFIGYDFAFGKKREGDSNTLKKLGRKMGFDVTVVEPIKMKNKAASSTFIRNLIKKGSVEEASKYLGRQFSIIGKVIRGQKRGKTLGFPTANINPHNELIPKEGVYIGEVFIGKEKHHSIINVGTNPTFGKNDLNIEAFIINFNKNIYGKSLKVSFLKRIRDEIRFKTPELLITQMREDLKKAKRFFKE